MRTPAGQPPCAWRGGRSWWSERVTRSPVRAAAFVSNRESSSAGSPLYTMCHNHCSHITHTARGLQTQAVPCRGHTVILPQASDHSHREVNYLEQFSPILSGPMVIHRYAVIHTRDDQAAHNSQHQISTPPPLLRSRELRNASRSGKRR